MKFAIRLFFILSIITTGALSQVTGILEDFNNADISSWESPQVSGTFTLSAIDSTLKIIYNRSGSSGIWDNFNYTPPENVVFSDNNRNISIRFKSNIATVLSIKPVYNEIENEILLENNLPDDDLWHTYNFEILYTPPLTMTRIYLYFDGGSTEIKSGTIYFDDLRIADSVRVIDTIDPAVLENAISDATNLRDNSTEGSGEGEFPPASKTILSTAIDDAQDVLDDPNVSKEEFDQAVWDLYDTCVTFETNANTIVSGLNDSLATKETHYLYVNLKTLSPTSLFFGMHDATGYGVGWKADDDRSDLKDVCGSMPAVFSEDMNKVGRNVDVDRVKYRLTNAYKAGSIITMCWHQYDPQDRGFYQEAVNSERIVSTILPGGQYHDNYKKKLRRIALFLKSLRGERGESIPVIFRPYHEHIGDWFWWGPSWCTTAEYNEIWQFTYHYLVDSLNVHNTIWALSPSLNHVDDGNDYYNVYPGDEYIDIFGTDQYFGYPISNADLNWYKNAIKNLIGKAIEKDKIFALTEVGDGSGNLSSTNFFTATLSALMEDTVTMKTSYAAVWRNESTSHHFAPYPGHSSVPDFLSFYNEPFSIFQNNMPNVYILGSMDTIPPVIIDYPDEHFTAFTTTVEIPVVTNERAFSRFALEDIGYDAMPYKFDLGQGTFGQTAMFPAEQGESYTLYIRSADYYGNKMTTSVMVSFDVDTLLLPVEWHDPLYPVNEWNSSSAPFVFEGNTGGTTEVPYSRTVYFRKQFHVENASSLVQLVAITNYDNGAVYYLNGHEVHRLYMPEGNIDYHTWTTQNKDGVVSVTLDAADLVFLNDGENTLAIEMHQAIDDSSDMKFDVKLISPDILIDFGEEWSWYSEQQKPDPETVGTVSIEDEITGLPTQIMLYPNYPNPFNPSTTIRFAVPNAGNVMIIIYDVTGRKVLTLFDGFKTAGVYKLSFDASKFASGTYYYQLKTDGVAKIRKMLLIK